MPDSKDLWVLEEIPHLVQHHDSDMKGLVFDTTYQTRRSAFVPRFGHNQQRRVPINVQSLVRVAAARPRVLATT